MPGEGQTQDTARRISPRNGWRMGILGSLVTLLLLGLLVSEAFVNARNSPNGTIPIDFTTFWAAGQLAVQDRPLDAFVLDELGALQDLGDEPPLYWLYPPGMLMAVTPFGYFSFTTSWLLMIGLSVVVFVTALWPLTRGRPDLRLAFAFAPGVLPCLMIGQTSILWWAGLLAAFTFLHNGRTLFAGIIIGCLTLKPQLGILIPVALVAATEWRTFAIATATAFALAVVPTLIYGIEYWPLMIEASSVHADNLASSADTANLVVGFYSVLAGMGVDKTLAFGAQISAILAVALCVWLVWRRDDIDWHLRAALVFSGTALVSPYFWYYETTLLVPCALLMLLGGAFAAGISRILLFLMWIGSAPLIVAMVINPDITGIEGELGVRYFMFPLCLAAFLLTLYTANRSQPAPAGSPT